ncbi:MAG: DUF3419 family protein [Gammaproteobacteria bacterium]|nr:DUF3419 family protein [Gammaproteobacteria bacterium]
MHFSVNEPPDWVHQSLNLPLRFAQVREDPDLDSWLVQQLPNDATLLVVGSGGCTLAVLASMPNVRSIHVVDPNPAQLALCRIKLALLRDQDPEDRLKFLGHRDLSCEKREHQLHRICEETCDSVSSFGPTDRIFEVGLDYAGRYESVFRQISKSVAMFPDSVLDLLRLNNSSDQAKWLQMHPDFVARLLNSFDQVMCLENLVALFGEIATQNPVMPFSTHFFQRTVHALHCFNARSNHFLWQVLASSAPIKPFARWLNQPRQKVSANFHFETETVQDHLAQIDVQFDYIHLSNVLDWLTEDEARALLELTWNRLKPKGFTLIRQLNSDLPIRVLGESFRWLDEESDNLHRKDLSYFYRGVHCGRRL